MRGLRVLRVGPAVTLVLAMTACGGGGGSSATTGTTTTTGGGNTAAPLVITTTSLPDALVGAAYSAAVTSSGGSAPISWSLAPNSPSWMSIDSSSGKLAGTPPANAFTGNNVVFITAKDSSTPQRTVTSSIIFFVAGILGGIPANLVQGTRFVPYSYQFQPTGGKGPFTAAITGGSLPPGVTVSNNNFGIVFSGTPTTGGTFNFTVQIKDSGSNQQTITGGESVVIDTKMVVTQPNLPYGILGRPYQAVITIVNDVPPLKWTGLPLGLIGNDSGGISGTPTQTTFGGGIQIADSSSPPQTAFFPAMVVYGPIVVPRGQVQQMRVGSAGGAGFIANGGVPPLAWSLQSGSAPPGLSLQAAGFVNGSPTAAGTYTFGVHVADSASPPQTYDEPVTVVVLPPLPSLTVPMLPVATVGQQYSAALQASGGTPPYNWNVIIGRVPPGMSIDSSGNLTGTPTVPNTYPFTVQIIDSANPPQTASAQTALVVRAHGLGRNDSIATASQLPFGSAPASISPYSDGTQFTPDRDYFKGYANGGATVTLSANVAFNSPLDPVMEIVDANGQRFQTCNDPTLNNPPAPIVGDTSWGNFTDECINDDASIGTNHSSSLSFKAPGTTGLTAFYVHVFDWRGDARPDMTYFLQAFGQLAPLTMSFNGGQALSVGVAYSASVFASGGSGTLSIQLAQGAVLPPGLSIDTAGHISGTPTTKGTYTFDVVAIDSGTTQQIQNTFTLEVASPLTVNGSLPQGTTGVAYNQTLAVSGGVPPYSFNFFSGEWCVCLTFDSTKGAVSGIPANVITYTGNVNIFDAEGRSAFVSLNLPVIAGPLFVAGSVMPSGTNGWVYDQLIPAQGGKPPYSFVITAGAIPPGMALDPSSGDLRGIPTASGTYSFTVSVTDSSSPTKQSISAPMGITIQ